MSATKSTLPLPEAGFRDRLNQVLPKFGSVAELARSVGVSDNAIYKWLAGRGQPSVANLVALARAAHVSLEWLATGQEPPPDGRATSRASEHGDYLFVPRYGARLTSSKGAAISSEQIIDYLAFRIDWVRDRLRVDPRNLLLVEARGDSMAPTLKDADLLLVDVSEPRFHDDAIYLLRHNGDLAVKRLQRGFDGKLVIRSDNRAYEPIIAQQSSVAVVGRVIWIARSL
jgi:phage repressor protein C with HTH and peptisase S24 domain